MRRHKAPGIGLWGPRSLLAFLIVFVIVGTYAVLWSTGALDRLLVGETLRQALLQLGLAGPLLIVALMTIAIVMSPIPSAPIALAAGAAYGHFWGALYVAAGSEAGALAAFGISRLLGYDLVRAWLGTRPSTGILDRFIKSQNALMVTVFMTRLLPFLSFDVISYAAGLTPLAAWRFALATLLGIVPASFLLAHFGDELGSADLQSAVLTLIALGALTFLPFGWRVLPSRYRSALRRLVHLD
jgi:uncharacterized membrane protein YdjX (TVP38/TMEM64 family)